MTLPIFLASENIACYLATANEFDAMPIIESIWQHKKACFVPILTDPTDKKLLFTQYHQGDVLQPNIFKILEPVHHTHVIHPSALDLVIVPLFSFDRQGNRLGTGGGYYDNTFEFLTGKSGWEMKRKPRLIGLGFADQEMIHLPHDPWDIKLDGVLTEKEFIEIFECDD